MAKSKVWGAIAEFENPAHLYESITTVRKSGYSKFEAYSPFPIHGIEDAMDLPGSKVPWITLPDKHCLHTCTKIGIHKSK